jgi:hypothetical protein
MADKATLIRETQEAYTELRRAVEALTEEEMRRVWFGTWGVREILIHISGWHEVMTPALARIARGEAPYPAGTYDDFDAWNARFVLQKTGVKTADVLAELDASHRQFVDAAEAVPEQYFETGGGAGEVLDGAGAGHYREHTAQIREWRQPSPGRERPH